MTSAWAFTLLGLLLATIELAAAFIAIIRQRWIYPRRLRPRYDPAWLPRCAIVIPTKGAGPELSRNLSAHLAHDYPDYEVIFAVEDESDAGVPIIRELVARSRGRARLVVAGLATSCSQQNLNMIAGTAAARGAEVLAYCDNDIAPTPGWLRSLVLPLSDSRTGVATGYRWHVAARGTVGEQIHAFTNMTLFAHLSLIAQLFGAGVWGGSFALRRVDYETWRVADRWGETISDDMGLMAILAQRRRRSVLTADVFLVTDDTIPTVRRAVAWYTRQILNVKACDRPMWWLSAFGTVLGAALVVALPVATAAWLAGGSFLNWGGGGGLALWSLEIALVLLYSRLGPTRHLGGLLLCVPVLRLSQAAAFIASVGVDSIVWAGVRYRFDRSGRVTEVTRGVSSAEA